MKKLWKQFAELATALKNSFRVDIFTEARLKIAFLYLLMGVVILGAAGYLVYGHVIAIVQTAVQSLDALFRARAVVSDTVTANLIAQTINVEIQKMNLTVGLWILFSMVIFAYILAGVTLWPIKRAMEKQRRFIADVAHELRTPLSVMKTDTEVTLLGAADMSREELIATLKSNLEEVDRLSKITQFLLDFSRFEGRISALQLSRVDLSLAAKNAAKLIAKTALKKGVTLNMLPMDPVMIKGNVVALEEMALNLLKNGISYTPSGGSVTVGISVRRAYGSVTLFVKDTGIGIAPEDLPTIFEPFSRGRNVALRRGNKNGSLGLGLAIVKEIANFHHATVAVTSTIGRGTMISVRFFSLFPRGDS